MRAARFPISSTKLAPLYGVTAQRVRRLYADFGPEVVTDPQALFEKLLDRRDCPLRTRLSDPLTRTQLLAQIHQ